MNKEQQIENEMKQFAKFMSDKYGVDMSVHKVPAEEVLGDKEEPGVEKVFAEMHPAVLDILLEKEKDFFAAMEQLEQKHKTLTTIEDIEKLTKDILKLCK
jgi:hypothetical protein